MTGPGEGFWSSCGFASLQRDARGWLVPTDDYLRLFLARPELDLVPESCRGERALHRALSEQPRRQVQPDELTRIEDADARDNYAMYLRFRDALLQAGTLEACYLGLFRNGPGQMAPLFIDLMAQAIVRNLIADSPDPWEARAGEMLFRAQRVSVQQGQLLAADRDTIDLLQDTGGLGELGRLLTQNRVALRALDLEVLGEANAERYWESADRSTFLLDLTHELTRELSHGLTLNMVHARSGLKALSRLLEKWVWHFLGTRVRIRPVQRIDDPAWRWHVGLDAESTAILNALYNGESVEPDRMQRIVSLFQLSFEDPSDMRSDVAGKPVYLGLSMNAEGVMRIKPQNLLINLPLAATM